MSDVARTVVFILAAAAIAALLLLATGEKGRLRQSGAVPVSISAGVTGASVAAALRLPA